MKHKGDTNVNAKIILLPDYNPQKYKVGKLLADVIPIKLGTKPQILLELINYIKVNRLQDEKDKRVVYLDNKLSHLFKKDVSSQIQYSDLPDLIDPHLAGPDPIVLEYTIRVDKQLNQSSFAYDMDVELDSIVRQKMMHVVAATPSQKEVMSLDDKIVQCVQSINNSKIKRDFLTQFSKDPIEFTNKWIASQTKELEIILGETKVNVEDVRQTDFYKQPWVKEAVFHYLTAKVFF